MLPPETIILPPEEVPAAVFLPAFKVRALEDVLVVLMAPVSGRSFVRVAMSTVPDEEIAPRLMALLSIRERFPEEATETVPPKLLPELFRVTLFPEPAVIVVVPVTPTAELWVIAPLLVRARSSLAVIAPFIAMVELFNRVVSSLNVVVPPTVIAPAEALPTVILEKPSVNLALPPLK